MLSFLAPAALTAMALAAVPVAIHLLTSRAATRRSFPALAFLRRAHAGSARWARLRDLVLLLLRLLAVLALALALAGPLWRGGGGAGTPAVVILDASASMHQRHLGASAWDHAVATAARLGDELGDRPLLLLVAGAPLQRSGLAPSLDRGAYRALLATARPGWGAGANDQAVALGLTLLAGGGDLHLISDGSRGSLAGIDPQALPAGIALHLVDAGGGGGNQGVKTIALEPGVAVAGRACSLRGEVANYGPDPATITVVLALGDDRRQSTITIPPGESAVVAETFTPALAGDLPASLAIVARDAAVVDHLAQDDRREGVVPVRASLPVAVYSDADPAATEGPLKPLLAGLTAAGLMPTVHRGAQLAQLPVAGDAPVVVTVALAATPADPGPLAAQLLAGGALLQVLVSDADAALCGALAGLDPPLMPSPPVDLAGRRRGLRLGELDLDHPLLDGLRGREPLLSQVEALRYRPAALSGGAAMLMAWEDGSVALAERRVGSGRWLALNASPADRDTNLAALEVLPLITARLGQVLLPRRRDDCALPCGAAVPSLLPFTRVDGRQVAVVDGGCLLDAPGLYRAETRLVAAAIPAGESDLRPVPAPAGGQASSAAQALADAGSLPLWPWVLLAGLVLLMVESLIAGGTRMRESRP